MSEPLRWIAPDGTTCYLLVAGAKPGSPLREFWLVTGHPHRDEAFVHVLVDGTLQPTRERDADWAPIYVTAARLALGAKLTPVATAVTPTAA